MADETVAAAPVPPPAGRKVDQAHVERLAAKDLPPLDEKNAIAVARAGGWEVDNLIAEMDQELEAAGAWVFGGGLHPASSATVVRATGGDVSMTDGPYAESKEYLGGFWVIQAADLDEALQWAKEGSAGSADSVSAIDQCFLRTGFGVGNDSGEDGRQDY